MPRCNFLFESGERCNQTNKISAIIFFDPENFIFEIATLHQQHSDLIIGEAMKSYENESKMIDYLEKRRKEEREARHYYEIKPDYSITDKIKDHYRQKTKISNYICRNPLCNKKLTKHDIKFNAITLHANGNLRHYFYYCSKTCMNTLKAKCGLIVPILNKQLSLVQ